MKYIIGLLVAIVIIFILLVFYQNTITPKYYQEELNKRNIYHKIKKDIKKGIARKEVYDVLNKKI